MQLPFVHCELLVQARPSGSWPQDCPTHWFAPEHWFASVQLE
jgi:hypothetical protein